MKKIEKNNEQILEEYIDFSKNNRKKLKVLEKYVQWYKKKYNIDIDIVYFHTDIEDAAKEECPGDVFGCYYKTGNSTIDNEPKKIEEIFYRTSDKPRGIIVCCLDRKGNLYHAFAYVIDQNKIKNNSKSNKTIIINDGNGETDIFRAWTARQVPTKQEYNDICKTKQPMSDTTVDNEYIKQLQQYCDTYKMESITPGLQQSTDICYILATMFCVEMLKDKATEFYKCVSNKYRTPLSILRYTQPSDDYNNDKVMEIINETKKKNNIV